MRTGRTHSEKTSRETIVTVAAFLYDANRETPYNTHTPIWIA
jgi:hypothetical protein